MSDNHKKIITYAVVCDRLFGGFMHKDKTLIYVNEEADNILKTKDDVVIEKYLKEIEKELDEKIVNKLKNSPGIRYFAGDTFHDSVITNVRLIENNLIINLNTKKSLGTISQSDDIEVTFKLARITDEVREFGKFKFKNYFYLHEKLEFNDDFVALSLDFDMIGAGNYADFIPVLKFDVLDIILLQKN